MRRVLTLILLTGFLSGCITGKPDTSLLDVFVDRYLAAGDTSDANSIIRAIQNKIDEEGGMPSIEEGVTFYAKEQGVSLDAIARAFDWLKKITPWFKSRVEAAEASGKEVLDWKAVRTWRGEKLFKFGALTPTSVGLVHTSNVRDGNNTKISRLFINGNLIKELKGAETFADVLEHDGIIYVASEHRGVLVLKNNTLVPHIDKSAGRWCVALGVWGGQPVGCFNDDYSARVFSDKAKVINLITKEVVGEFPVNGMPTSILSAEDVLLGTITFNNRNERVVDVKGDLTIRGNYRCLAAFRDRVYIGGGGAYTQGAKDGNIYRIEDDGTVTTIFDTGSSSVNKMVKYDNRLWFSSSNPDKVGFIDGSNNGVIVEEWNDDNGKSTFDTNLCVYEGIIRFGRTAKGNIGELYKILPK